MAALGWACLKGRVQATQCLLDQGSDLNGADKKGRSPLFLAAYKGDPEVVQVSRNGILSQSSQSFPNNLRRRVSFPSLYVGPLGPRGADGERGLERDAASGPRHQLGARGRRAVLPEEGGQAGTRHVGARRRQARNHVSSSV